MKLGKIILSFMSGLMIVMISLSSISYSQGFILAKSIKSQIQTTKNFIPNLPQKTSRFDGTKFAQNWTGTKNGANKQTVVSADTSNSIQKVWSKNEQFYVRLSLMDYQSDITLTAYNMLGKEVLKIHQGTPKPKDTLYEFSSSELPNGVYICVLQGKSFRDAEKFIVSRSR